MPTNRLTRTTRTVGAAALGLGLTLGAAACGTDPDEPTSSASQTSATEHNDADVAFATEMMQHHAQALSMVDLTRGRPLDPEVQTLAEEIRDAQAPEIETFTDWLIEWGQPIPETTRDHENGGHGDKTAAESMEGMEDTDMPGMMTADDMTALESASDAEFEDMWLEMMTEHHAGAIEMAEAEVEGGQHEPAVELARSIISSQSQEIETMKGLLA